MSRCQQWEGEAIKSTQHQRVFPPRCRLSLKIKRPMFRKKRLIFTWFLGGLILLIGIPCWKTGREIQQQYLNRQLIAAIRRKDTATALALLSHGADANSHAGVLPSPVWRVLWDRLQGKLPAPSDAPTALLLALRAKDTDNTIFPSENLPLITALLSHGARINV